MPSICTSLRFCHLGKRPPAVRDHFHHFPWVVSKHRLYCISLSLSYHERSVQPDPTQKRRPNRSHLKMEAQLKPFTKQQIGFTT